MEIIANMLDITRNGALKTHLMYRANLSFMVVTQYLGVLEGSGLVEQVISEDEPKRLYKTTAKGFQYMEVYQSLQDIAGIDSRNRIGNSGDIFA